MSEQGVVSLDLVRIIPLINSILKFYFSPLKFELVSLLNTLAKFFIFPYFS